MDIVNFFKKESSTSIKLLIGIGLLSGMANSVLLAIINIAAEQLTNRLFELELFIFYAIAFTILAYTQKFVMMKTTMAMEEMIRNIRVRLTDKIRLSELRFIEQSGQAEFYAQLTERTNTISQTGFQLSFAMQSIFLIVMCLFYLAFVSLISLVMTCLLLLIAIPIHFHNNRIATEKHKNASQVQTHLFDSFSHILNGFKELKCNHKKAEDLLADVKKYSHEVEMMKVDATYMEVTLITFVRLSFYVLLAILIFVLSSFGELIYTSEVFKTIATMLFIMGPINGTVYYIPMINRANIAIRDLYELEEKLDAHIPNTEKEFAPFTTFQTLQLDNVGFNYVDNEQQVSFTIEQINFTLQKGELVFIVGGNGSGKSTLMKVLTGLYAPSAGEILLDGVKITAENAHNYRELFALIFTDFHLFNRLYGVGQVSEKVVNEWLVKLGLDKKTQFKQGCFTNTSLSTGQRKRLGLLIALLENKPVLILDEFAADQDPPFRQYFYETLLQELRASGKTIIAVSHDDKYFGVADRVLKMEYGQLVPYPLVLPTVDVSTGGA